MPFEAALIVAFLVVFTALFIVIAMFGNRQLRAREEELTQAASTRGWTFEKLREGGYRVYRFRGTTEGIPWQAESAVLTAGSSNKGQRRRHIARWHGEWSPGINAPIVAMGVPKGKEQIGKAIATGDGLFARLAQQAAGFAFDKALDVYFGKEVGDEIDARTLTHIGSAAVPGFIVMAGNVDEANRVLQEGLQKALLDASNDRANVLSEEDRPYVLVRSRGISLARAEQLRNIADVERFVHAGVGLTRAFRFGRRV